jgi:hypothetical protein
MKAKGLPFYMRTTSKLEAQASVSKVKGEEKSGRERIGGEEMIFLSCSKAYCWSGPHWSAFFFKTRCKG